MTEPCPLLTQSDIGYRILNWLYANTHSSPVVPCSALALQKVWPSRRAHEAARVHNASQRRGGVADHGARTADDTCSRFLSTTAQVTTKRIASFSGGLREAGQIVDRDVAIKQRLADGHYHRLPALAADLVKQRVSLIAALAPPAAFAAKAATTTIPIVFVGALDPVKAGLVESLNRPGATSRALLSSVRLSVPNDLSLPASSFQTLA